MKRIKNDCKELPMILYGSPILRYNINNRFKFYMDILKKLIKFKFKELKKDYSLYKITKVISKSNLNIGIDTSSAYGASEFVIGKAIKRATHPFIVTKVCNRDQYSGDIEESLKNSLKQMNIDCVDLYLMHWPVEGKYLETWKKMEELQKKGLCKSIGVCNCNIRHLEEIKKIATIMPVVNQIECHPLFTQNELRDYCRQNNIRVMAYTSIARMDERLRKTCLVDLAKKYNKSIAQIILRWHIQIGNIPIFNTSKINSYKSNIDIFDFELTEEEVNKITAININSRLRYDPDNCDFTQL